MEQEEPQEPQPPETRQRPEPPPEPEFRTGYVALAGAPNVGKSTLMNRFLKEKLAIITPKPQTTRRKTLGILNGPGYQMVLLDTPGLMEPKYDLHHAMLREAQAALHDADVLLLLAEAQRRVHVPDMVSQATVPRILALNKVDLVKNKTEILPLLTEWNETGLFQELVPISALDGTGTDELLRVLVPLLPLGPPFYPPDQIADQPERFFVGEIVRERLFEQYEQEIPYATEVVVEEFTERPAAKDYIEAVIFVEQESQKGIIIGKDGAAIRLLGEKARGEIEEFLGRQVFLSLRVRVLPKWRRRSEALRRLGYRK
jgi:GTPase